MDTTLASPVGEEERPSGVYVLISSLVVTFLNGASAMVVWKSNVINSKMKVCFLGQLGTDFLIGITGLVSGVNMVVNRRETFQLCVFIKYVGFSCGTTTSLMILLQAMDRFLVLRLTFAYTTWITTSKMVVIVVVLFVFGTASTCAMFNVDYERVDCTMFSVSGRPGYIYIVTVFGSSMVMIICLHSYVWKKARDHVKRIHDVHNFQGSVMQTVFSAKEIRNLVTMVITVSLYCVCYLPAVISMMDLLVNNWEDRLSSAQGGYITAVFNLYLANSLLNPLVYIWRQKRLRVDIFKSCRLCLRPTEGESTSERARAARTRNVQCMTVQIEAP